MRIGIAHRDIKPHNVLLFEESPGMYVAEIADLGYSVQLNDGELEKMPRSTPWEAPEWHHRWHTRARIFKMDVYSFGMVCLWLLFRERLSDSGIAFDAKSYENSQLREAKMKDWLCAISRDLVFKATGLSTNQVESLIEFFNSCLLYDIDKRDEKMERLIELLGGEMVVHSTNNAELSNPMQTEPFSVSKTTILLLKYVRREYY